MISKNLFYVWLGDGNPDALFDKCLESWKRYCPDYTITRIDESNFDIDGNEVTKELYSKRQYAAVSDYIRAKVLCDNSGFYMDTDLELVKPIDTLINYDFVIYKVPNSIWKINNAFIGASKGNSILSENVSCASCEEFPLATLDRIISSYNIGEADKDICIGNWLFLGQDAFILPNQRVNEHTYGIHHTRREWANNTNLLTKEQIEKIKAI